MLFRRPDAAARLDTVARRVVRPLARAERRLDRAAEAIAVVLAVLTDRGARLLRALVADVALPLLVGAHRLAQQHVLAPSAQVPGASSGPTAPPRRGLGVRALGLASAVVFVIGIGAVSTASAPAPARAVTAAVDEPVRSPLVVDDGIDVGPARPEARAVPPEPVPSTSLPAFEPPRPEPTAEPAVSRTRWLPTGTGMWLHDWGRSEGGAGPRLVERSLAIGLSHVFVQTGSSKKGWIGEEVLSELLPATEGTGLKVVAWDFPKLIDPEGDARRMAQAAQWSRPGVPRVAAVAPDVETSAEGTHVSPDAVSRYYAELRRQLPPEIAVLATVPWPSEKRTGSYPYAETAVHSDAFLPMAYWYNRSPAVVTQTSMEWLARFGKPVMPVGQGYDGRVDAPYLPEDPDPAGSVQAFVDAARAGGAASISLWSWQTTGGPQWGVLTAAGALPWTPAVGVPVPETPGRPVG